MTRGREELVEQRVALCNQLRAELERFWPAATVLFTEAPLRVARKKQERGPDPAGCLSAGPGLAADAHSTTARFCPRSGLERPPAAGLNRGTLSGRLLSRGRAHAESRCGIRACPCRRIGKSTALRVPSFVEAELSEEASSRALSGCPACGLLTGHFAGRVC
jgi:hypothetical protein